jgi:hypothetical protein
MLHHCFEQQCSLVSVPMEAKEAYPPLNLSSIGASAKVMVGGLAM